MIEIVLAKCEACEALRALEEYIKERETWRPGTDGPNARFETTALEGLRDALFEKLYEAAQR